MATAQQTDTGCGAIATAQGVQPGAVSRFVVGEELPPRLLSPDEITADLGDPFASLLLAKGVFPRTAEDALAELATAVPDGDPLKSHRAFVVGEGSQLAELAPDQQNIHFVVATGANPGNIGPDVIVSAPDPKGEFVELMAWDRTRGGFNYYQTVRDAAWVFAGNSEHALTDPTQNKGPFESHKSGAFLMKELEFPWLHWHSFAAVTAPTVFEQADPRRDHEWFNDKQGADILELEVAMPAMKRWAVARFERIAAQGGQVSDPGRILTQLTETHTVNLVTSDASSRSVTPDQPVGLPPGFFFDVRALTAAAPEGIGLTDPGPFTVPAELYQASVKEFELANVRPGVNIPGDAHFAFVVPVRAHEDQVVLEEALRTGLLTRRLAAALLMVDFPNPIFSERRKALQARVPTQATVADGASSFSEEMADNILQAASDSPDGSPEREFAQRWEVGEAFEEPFNKLLSDYARAVSANLQTQEGINAYTRLATSRRERCRRDMPILKENSLVMPSTNLPDAELRMAADGTVTETNS